MKIKNMTNKNIISPFNDDKDKMRDFYNISKKEFLQTYSYINEASYVLTFKREIMELYRKLGIVSRYYDNNN